MNTITFIIQIVVTSLCLVAALLSILLFVKLKWPSPGLWILKLYTSALSRVLAITGALSLVVGLITHSYLIDLIGTYTFLVFFMHVVKVTRPPRDSYGFSEAFRSGWEKQLMFEQTKYFLPSRAILKLPKVPAPQIEQDIAFAKLPNTKQQLLCDIWQPPSNVSPSGLAFIYLHGSAWYLLDKDCGTRPFFTQLTSQGHVIMDVAYRLSPETGIMGMVHDVKRAISYLKENAFLYQINPEQIVLGGGSAGAHLALLSAYTAHDQHFSPPELVGKDVSVCGVISLYGPADLEAMYYHTNQHLTTRFTEGKTKKNVASQMPRWIKKAIGKDYHRLGFDKGFVNAGALAPLLGGHPDECPETYEQFSPLTHVHSRCPSTLLIHGDHDVMAPVKSTYALYAQLIEEKIPTILHTLPQTDHAFDLVLPNISPAAHNALYDVERFLALQSKKTKPVIQKDEEPVLHNSYY